MHKLAAMDDLQKIWPTWSALADDLGLPYTTVQSWGARGVPPKRYFQVIEAAENRGHDLSFAQLATISERLRSGAAA